MSGIVTRKLRSFTASDPTGGEPDMDPWKDFREIELIDMPLTFRFDHSMGKLSRFYLELENRRFMGTRCPKCDRLWMPPRVMCPEDWTITSWEEVAGHGILEVAARSAYQRTGGGSEDLVLGYVRLDGAHTSLLHRIENFGDSARLVHGLPVKAAWSEVEVGHPMELFWFEPSD